MVIFSLRNEFFLHSILLTVFFSANTECMLSKYLKKTKDSVPKIVPCALFLSTVASKTVLDCFDECVLPEHIQNFTQCFYDCKKDIPDSFNDNANANLANLTIGLTVSLSTLTIGTLYYYFYKEKNKKENFNDLEITEI